MSRLFGLGLLLCAARAVGAPPESADGGMGFRLEGRPAIDDVFGDSSDYRRTIDRFLELTAQMQAMRDEFARAVQTTLRELQQGDGRAKKVCPTEAVAAPYA